MIEQQFDGLQPEDQRMLEAASVAGVEFAVAAVAAATETTQAWVEDRCAGLERRAQWLQARGVEEWPDGTVAARYAFRHALYQQVLYDRLPVGRRVQLHRQLGAREAAGYGERAWEKAAELAVHFDRGRDAAQAVPYLRQAAANALGRYAYVEAIAHCTRGLALLQTLPDTPERAQHELALQTTLGSALVATKGFTSAEVEQAYRRARELCGQVGETAHLFPVLWGLWLFYSGRSQLQAYALVEHLVRVAHQTQEPTLLLQAYHAQWGTLFALGELELTRTCLQQGSALYSAQRHSWGTWPFAGHDPGVCCYGYTGLMLWLLGYPSQAVEQVREMLHLATQLAHPLSLASAYTNASYLALLRRDRQALQEQMEAQTAVTSEHDFTYHLTARVIVQSWTALEQAPTAEGIARLQQSLASYRDAGTAEWYPYFLTLLAEAHRQTGQTEAGLAVLAEALALVDRSAERWCEAELYRLKGELLLALSAEKQPESETCLHQALAIARRQQAKAWELRAAMSLARLWQRQGKGGEAQQLLAEVYGWFTEGFDTADLQEAQALLEELA
jgi:predicted ATPase